MFMDNESIMDSFSRTAEDIFSLEEFKRLLGSGRRLRIKYGVDVTAPDLHIGHAVNLWMMRKLQDMGHKVIFLIGDFTTRIGDPTGKNRTRPVIPQEEIERNTAKFISQVKMVLKDDPELLEVRRNSEWLGSMNLTDFLGLLSMVTHLRLISRDMFQKRLSAGDDIHMHEMIYPILQGYDSFALKSDLTIIGSDQLFNEMLGRFYQERLGQEPQVIITTKITPGIDGREKQSKSLGNYIGLTHSPRDKFGRIMSIPDNLIVEYLKVYTDVPMEEIARIEGRILKEPMECKKLLAREIVKLYHGEETALKEQLWFEETFSQNRIPEDIPELRVTAGAIPSIELLKAFFGAGKSNSELRKLFSQGAVSIDGEKAGAFDMPVEVRTGMVVRVGKRTWFRVKV